MVSKQFKKLLKEKEGVNLSEETPPSCSFFDLTQVNHKNSFNALADYDNEIILNDFDLPQDIIRQKNTESSTKRKKKNVNKEKKKVINELSGPIISDNDSMSCLIMNKQNFNCDNEICSIFGNEAVKIEKRSHSKRLKPKNNYLNVRHYFVSCDPQWPHLNREESGLIMKYIEEKNEFSISFDIEYIKKKEVLDILIDSMLLDEIYIFMERNPFFLNGLLRLAEISILREEHETAFKHLQKALYVFESSLHPSFSPFKCKNGLPNTAIKSNEIESRDIYILLGYYMTSLGNRGLFRTALEYCLLLISMDIANDRFHSLLHIDYYSILSSEFEIFFEINTNFIHQFQKYCTWDEKKIIRTDDSLKTLSESFPQSIPLYYILPNFAFGIPLALYIKYTKIQSFDKELFDAFNQQINNITIEQITNSNFDTDHFQDCSIFLIQSMIMFPEFVRLLRENLENSQNECIFCQWDEIYKFLNNLLQDISDFNSDVEYCSYPNLLVGKLLVEANVEKCKQIWKKPIYLNWMNACCKKIHNIITGDTESLNLIKSFVSKRRNILMESKFNVFRYLDVKKSEFYSNPTLPEFFREEYIEKRGNFLESNSMNSNSISLSSDPISLYLLSLLPWYTVNQNSNDTVSINLTETAFECFNALKNYLNRRFS